MHKMAALDIMEEPSRKLHISKICREIAGGRFRGFLLKRKLNPEVLAVLADCPNQRKDYIRCIKNREKSSFNIVHDLEDSDISGISNKLKMNRYLKAERRIGAKIIGRLSNKKIFEGSQEKALLEGKESESKIIKKDNSWIERVDNEDNNIEKEAIKRIKEQSGQGQTKDAPIKGNEK